MVGGGIKLISYIKNKKYKLCLKCVSEAVESKYYYLFIYVHLLNCHDTKRIHNTNILLTASGQRALGQQ